MTRWIAWSGYPEAFAEAISWAAVCISKSCAWSRATSGHQIFEQKSQRRGEVRLEGEILLDWSLCANQQNFQAGCSYQHIDFESLEKHLGPHLEARKGGHKSRMVETKLNWEDCLSSQCLEHMYSQESWIFMFHLDILRYPLFLCTSLCYDERIHHWVQIKNGQFLIHRSFCLKTEFIVQSSCSLSLIYSESVSAQADCIVLTSQSTCCIKQSSWSWCVLRLKRTSSSYPGSHLGVNIKAVEETWSPHSLHCLQTRIQLRARSFVGNLLRTISQMSWFRSHGPLSTHSASCSCQTKSEVK